MSKAKKETKASKSRERAAAVASELSSMDLLGEIITWNARNNETEHTHAAVLAALKAADLDEDVARELLPRHAFSRASKALEGERVIDVVRDGADVITFQFTKRFLSREEWKYATETRLDLNKVTGRIRCDIAELQEVAQKELDRAIEVRTTSDISRIVQQLFEKHADLFAVRDQGGVYFVPQIHMEFTTKIDSFLKKLGGSVRRFPIPKGTQFGDSAVQESIQDALAQLVDSHEIAIGQFTVSTRADTLESAAEKIKATRTKIEAYANYLGDMRDELLASIDAANVKLVEAVEKLSDAKEAMPKKERTQFMGNAVTAVIRWMGKEGWSYDEAAAVLTKHGVAVAVNTIRIQLREGTREDSKPPAKLTKVQEKELKAARAAYDAEKAAA